MNIMSMRALAAFVSLLAVLLVTAVACGDDSTSEPNGGPPAVSRFDNADTEPKGRSIEGLFEPMTLGRSDPADMGSFSRMSFYFIERIPNYQVRYIEEPTFCGSGGRVAMDGDSFLQVTFTPARAHDDAGVQSHALSASDADAMPAVADIVQTCDFEGQLTFVFGLEESDVPFRTNFLTEIGLIETVAIDIQNPD